VHIIFCWDVMFFYEGIRTTSWLYSFQIPSMLFRIHVAQHYKCVTTIFFEKMHLKYIINESNVSKSTVFRICIMITTNLIACKQDTHSVTHVSNCSLIWAVAAPGGTQRGQMPPQNDFLPPPHFAPPSKKFISHWERLKATQVFCRYRKMYGL
jgi:hypothetical protein